MVEQKDAKVRVADVEISARNIFVFTCGLMSGRTLLRFGDLVVGNGARSHMCFTPSETVRLS